MSRMAAPEGTSTSNDVIIPVTEDWLSNILKGSDREPPDSVRAEHRMPRVDKRLLQIESLKESFYPSVVSFGPYHHHGGDHLAEMERFKKVTARWFISLPPPSNNPQNAVTVEDAKDVYYRFVKEVEKLKILSFRKWYCVESVTGHHCNETELMRMMFLDGCFILYFIRFLMESRVQFQHYGWDSIKHKQALILRDMFLLENQIPYSVLKALRSVKPSSLRDMFVRGLSAYDNMCGINDDDSISTEVLKGMVKTYLDIAQEIRPSHHQIEVSSEVMAYEAFHLLDSLRFTLVPIGKRSPRPSSPEAGSSKYLFRPVMELKATGIRVTRSNLASLKNVRFKKGLINSYLELPQIIVDDRSKTPLLNLAAYEMWRRPNGEDDRPHSSIVASYICLLGSLIYNAEDVKELRSNGILLNRLGTDEEVATLFKVLAHNSTPDFDVYSHVIQGMEQHIKRRFNHVRLWIDQLMLTYFTSPWTVISLVSAIAIIAFTAVQAIYGFLSYNKKSN